MPTSVMPDIIVIGTGMGGATAAWALAPTGARILILDKGHQLLDIPENRDARAIFQRGHFRPKEAWYDAKGAPFSPGNYYNHGGNSKFYGAVLLRYQAQDFEGVSHADGDAPPWPICHSDLEPWYDAAEALYQVRGALGQDPTEPHRNGPYPHGPVPDEPAVARVRDRLAKIGLHPFSLPLGVDVERWLAHAKTPWDTFPDARSGKMDAETCALIPALEHPNVMIESGASVRRLIPTRTANGSKRSNTSKTERFGRSGPRCSSWRRVRSARLQSCSRRATAASPTGPTPSGVTS